MTTRSVGLLCLGGALCGVLWSSAVVPAVFQESRQDVRGPSADRGDPVKLRQSDAWNDLAHALRSADRIACAEMYSYILSTPEHPDRFAQLEAWMRRWIELDPVDALTYLERTTGSWHSRERALELWAMIDGPSAYRYALKHLGRSDREMIVGVFRKHDPRGAAAFATQDEDFRAATPAKFAERSDADHLLSRDGFAQLLERQKADPLGTGRWLAKEGLKDREARSAMLMRVHSEFTSPNAVRSQIEPEFLLNFVLTAWHSLASADDADNRPYRAMSEALSRLAESNPDDALTWIQKLPPGFMRSDVLNGFISGWARTDPTAAIAWASDLVDSDPAAEEALSGVPLGMLTAAVKEWASSDSGAAAGWIRKQPDNLAKALAGAASENLAKHDLETARQFAEEGMVEERDLTSIVRAWPEDSLDDAAAWLTSLSPSALKAAVEVLVVRWVPHDPGAASAWVSRLEDGEERDLAAMSLVDGLVRSSALSDFPAALAWAQAIKSDGYAFSAYGVLFHHWKEVDPEAAAFAIMNSPDQRAGVVPPVYSMVSRSWAYRDLAAAEHWVSSLQGLARDHAASGLVNSLIHSRSHWHYHESRNPEAAFLWAQTIADPVIRRQALQGALDATDGETALRWIAEAPLDREDSSDLLQRYADKVEGGGEG